MKDSVRKIIAIVLAVLLNLFFIGGFFYAQYKDDRASLWSGGRGDEEYQVAYIDLEPVKVINADVAVKGLPDVSADNGVVLKKVKKRNQKHLQKKQAETQKEFSGTGDSDTPAGGVGAGLDAEGVVSSSAPNVLAAIRKKIMKKKVYPLIAKENHWTGSVKVNFKIAEDGGVEFVKVIKGSGHDALDKAAINTVKLAAPLPFYPQVIALVLEYRLE